MQNIFGGIQPFTFLSQILFQFSIKFSVSFVTWKLSECWTVELNKTNCQVSVRQFEQSTVIIDLCLVSSHVFDELSPLEDKSYKNLHKIQFNSFRFFCECVVSWIAVESVTANWFRVTKFSFSSPESDFNATIFLLSTKVVTLIFIWAAEFLIQM